MRQRASTAGNIVGKDVPVSSTEVLTSLYFILQKLIFWEQDDNKVLRTWHPDGPNGKFEQRTDIMPHHEVLLRLDAMDLDRGATIHLRWTLDLIRMQVQRSQVIEVTS